MQFCLTGLPVAGNFVRRDAEMEQVERLLLPAAQQEGRKIHVLHGLGGIGKTQLAIAYARKHQETYSAILWLNGNSTDTLLQSFAAFATHADINDMRGSTLGITGHDQEVVEKANAVRRWLALEGNRQWLMVFDNVDRDHEEGKDPQAYDIESFLPAVDHGSILITTRLRHLGGIGNGTRVSKIDPKQAFELLTYHSCLPRSTPGNSIC